MKSFLRLIRILAATLLGTALLFSCQKPNIDDPNNQGNKKIPVESVKLDVTAKELAPNETFQLTATLLPENATNKDDFYVSWSTSDQSVARVSDSGLVTAIHDGTAIITVSISADKKAQCEVTVKTPDHMEGIIKGTDFGQQGGSSDEEKAAGIDLSYQFAPRAALASKEVMDALTDVEVHGNQVRFTLPATKDPYYGSTSSLSNDDIIIFGDSEAFPGGAAIKIETSNANLDTAHNSDSYVYDGHQVSIEEVFQNLHMETSQLALGEVQRILDEDGNEVDFTNTKGGGGFEITIPELFGDNFSASLNLGENLSITPKMKIGFNMDIAADVVDFKLTYARCRVEASADLACDITFKASVDKTFKTKQLTVFLGAIPIGPIVISPVITMDFEVKLSGQVDLTLSVAYQKSVYAHAFYNGSNLQCRVGETTPSDPKDPFSVSGNLSGGVEFGPNLGMGVSLYGGALALGVDFDPHMVFTVFSSYPISLEGLKNIGNGTFWLANAGYEPSLAFSFGGYIQAGYAWTMDFDLPEELGLSYSFGKTYIIPQVDGETECRPEYTAATFTTHLKNKAMCDGDMYMKVKEEDDPSDNWKVIPLTADGKPNNEEAVEANAIFSPMKPFQRYKATGPFMKFTLFGKEIEAEMVRNYSHTFYSVDEKTDKAVRALLADIYACGDGNWKDCNWMDPEVPFYKLDNIVFTYDSDQQAATYADIEDYARKKLTITVPDTWKMGDKLTIGNCTSSLDDLEWDLCIYGGPVFDSIEIEDPNFRQPYGEYNTARYDNLWPAKSRIVIHSKRFGGSFRPIAASSKPQLYVDLSGTGIDAFATKMHTLSLIEGDDAPSLSGTVILDNCKHLTHIRIDGPDMPKEFSFKDCPKLHAIDFYDIPTLLDISKYAGASDDVNFNYCGGAIHLGKDWTVKRQVILNSGAYTNLNLDGVQGEAIVDVAAGSSTASTTVANVFLSSCPGVTEFSAIGSAEIETIEITDCTKIERITMGRNGCDTWAGPLRSISVSGCPSLKSVQIHSSQLNGTLPSFIRDLEGKGYASYPYLYDYYIDQDTEKLVSKAHSNGYTMPGEPGRPYRHCLGGYIDVD